jgi:hypothetical protein
MDFQMNKKNLTKFTAIEKIFYQYIKLSLVFPFVILLASCGKSDLDAKSRTSVSPSKTVVSNNNLAEISELKFRYDDRRISFVAKVKNTSPDILKGKSCMRFYDKDGFEINKLHGDVINIESKGEDAINGSGFVKDDLIDQIKTIKLYVARFGCADSPAEAISAVLNTNFNIPEKIPANEKSAGSAKANLFETNLYMKATEDVCSKVTDLTQDYATDLAMSLGVSASSLRFIKSDGCLMILDTPVSPRKCSITGVFRLKNGVYAATNFWQKEDGNFMKMGSCLSAEMSRW